MNLISITMDANSTACAVKNGEVIAAISEERFNRIKNYIGYPKEAVEYCVEQLGGKIDKIIVPSIEMDPVSILIHWTRRSVAQKMEEQHKYWHPKIYGNKPDLDYMKVLPKYCDYNQYPGPKKWAEIDFEAPLEERVEQFRDFRKQMIADHLGVSKNIIVFKEHHLCHAYYAYYASPIRNKPVLCFTADGFGDYYCASLRAFDKNGNCKVLMETDQALLGRLYRFVTLVLKMRPLEDEYKVMGLAPYSTEYHWKKPYKIFKKLLDVDGIDFVMKNRPKDFFFYYQKKLESCRFDAIAGGLQKFLEEMIVKWVSNAIKQTGIKNVVFSGGVSMNVKAMMEVSKIVDLETLHVPPSGADESLCIGACYHDCSEYTKHTKIKPLKNAYLGDTYTNQQICDYIKSSGLEKDYSVSYNTKASDVASLLEKGNVIAVFLENMEFGARALGSRSIIADPRRLDVVKVINYKIKNRDFWMPFAPVVLDRRFDDYFVNEKNIISPYMTVGFETTPLARKQLPAALHQADLTGRPQRIDYNTNPMYYNIIQEFEKLTGVGALLNTSFNLHGLPIVRTPADAMHVMDNSHLDALLLNDILIKRK